MLKRGSLNNPEYGEYFSWGDIIGHNKNGPSDGYSFNQDNYKAGKSGSGYTLTGDITPDDVRYDAAAANMESPWRMPTKAQFEELINKTTTQWTSINGVNGRKFTNKSDSNTYIFLPVGGRWDDTYYNDAGSQGYYWSATYNSSTTSHAWSIYFYSSRVTMISNNRYCGFPIRPIKY